MVENEVVFRSINKRALNYVDELEEIANDDQATEFLRYDDTALYFHCECADENCRDRISIKPSTLGKIHENNRRFIVLPGHQVMNVEKIIKKLNHYYIVEKYSNPPESATHLNKTSIDNTNK